ncbi:MAG: TIGR01212 family radical SAM protein [Candidatus Pacebacteria bacterium]|nr:TIGR01212 family radical SAM protein [Candidatus Paceibacterota bacterium]
MTDDLPFYSHKQCMIDRYGKSLFRVPIDAGLGCPHRGPDGNGGCTFCPGDGSRARQTTGRLSITDQIDAGVKFARDRYRAEGFMAYVQSFTGTHAPHEELESLYHDILSYFPFDAISIGTRPDCLGDRAMAVLELLGSQLDVWIELGIQTVHDRTLERIRRGHRWADSLAALRALHSRGLLVVGHVLLGLPGETTEDFQKTAQLLSQEHLAAVKIHNLHVIKGTTLAEEFATHPFPVFDSNDFSCIVTDFIRRTPAGVAIMRVNTDTPPDRLVAPRWTISKGSFREQVIAHMRREGFRQGDLCSSSIIPLDGSSKLGQASAP